MQSNYQSARLTTVLKIVPRTTTRQVCSAWQQSFSHKQVLDDLSANSQERKKPLYSLYLVPLAVGGL